MSGTPSPDQAMPCPHVRYAVLGAGPGGLQTGFFLERAGLDYVVLDRSDRVGSFFSQYPRHRRLISINKRHNYFPEDEFNERHDWNSLLSDDPALRFTNYSDDLFPDADLMCDYLADYAARLDLRVHLGVEVNRIERAADGFRLHAADGSHMTCDVLLLGTGAVTERRPDIEGIDLTTPYGEHSTDLEHYRNKRVGILGQGNSAFETADHIAGVAAYVNILGNKPIQWAWNSHFTGDLRAVNNNVIDMFQLKSMHAVLAPRLVRIEAFGGVLRTTHEYDYPDSAIPGTLQLTRDYDEIICATGFNWSPSELFDEEIRPETWAGEKFPVLSPVWESTNVKHLYVVGGAMQGSDRRSASGFIHGFRYNVRTLARLLLERYENVSYPTRELDPFDWSDFENYLYHRLSTSAGLFQLFGTLCDVILVDPEGGRAVIREELPVALAATTDYDDAHVFTVTLEFGFDQYADPAVTFMGPSDPTDPDAAAFLHPVVRHRRGSSSDEFHFSDSLLGRWDLPHAEGGAVTSRQGDFRRWVSAKLGIEPGDVSELSDSFRPWGADEISRWQERRRDERNDRRTNPLSNADQRYRLGYGGHS